jgi:glycogen debranching enzyme
VQPEEVDLLKSILLSDSFCNPRLLPSLASTSEHFDADGDYWRGRVWPPLVYLAAMGFKRWNKEAYQKLKDASIALLNEEWERHHHIHENYSALSGEGEPQPGTYARSCPLYSWGGLLGIV